MEMTLFRQIELLTPLTDEDLRVVIASTKEKRVSKGSIVVAADEPGPCLFFLLSGEAKVSLTAPDGKEFLITLLEEGEIFGELSVLTGEERSADVTALTDCHLGIIPAIEFLGLLDKIPALSKSLLKLLAYRLRNSSAKLGELALLDVTERVKQTLRSLAVEDRENGGLVVTRRPTHQMLASMVGTSREMVTRALSLLEETHEIKTEGKLVHLISEKTSLG